MTLSGQTRRRFASGVLIAAVLSCAIAQFGTAQAQDAAQNAALSAYNAPLTETSVSGISSGAYMAVQFATAWSSFVKGVGAIAGGPYGCTGGQASTALSTCMQGDPAADIAALGKLADQLSAQGQIDSLTNIAHEKVYLFHGYNDAVVGAPVTNWLDTIYEHWLGQNVGNLFYQTSIGAGHSQVTLNYGATCPTNGGHYINDCDYDQAGVILRHIYGVLNPPNRGMLGGTFITFAQSDYTVPAKPSDDSMGDKGFVFVPADCASGAQCRVHVVLHGCLQSFANIGDDFVRHAGYNEWADTNRIIVVYPQTTPSDGVAPLFGVTNPEACWDWWGYLDADPETTPRYLTKAGPQIAALKAMIDRLTGGGGNAVTAIQPATPSLTAPSLIANDVSDREIALAWTIVPAATGYQVYRAGPADAELSPVATVTGFSFGDHGLAASTDYRYQVRPVTADNPAGDPASASAIVTQATRARTAPCNDPSNCKVQP
jgi:hypothetical protein